MLTDAEKTRLENYKSMATLNQEQIADYVGLLNKADVAPEPIEVIVTEEVEEPKKRGRKAK